MLVDHFSKEVSERLNTKMDRFTFLPIMVQSDPTIKPLVKFLPDYLNYEVRLRITENQGFSSLGLKWYAIPAVSNV